MSLVCITRTTAQNTLSKDYPTKLDISIYYRYIYLLYKLTIYPQASLA